MNPETTVKLSNCRWEKPGGIGWSYVTLYGVIETAPLQAPQSGLERIPLFGLGWSALTDRECEMRRVMRSTGKAPAFFSSEQQ